MAVVGVSGSGKSTLLGLLAVLDLPTEGEITLAGHRLSDLDEDGTPVHQACYWVTLTSQPTAAVTSDARAGRSSAASHSIAAANTELPVSRKATVTPRPVTPWACSWSASASRRRA